MLTFVDQQLAALETNTPANFHDFFQMLNEEHGTRQLNMTKVPRGIDVHHAVRGTNCARVQDSHARVKESPNARFVVDVGVPRRNLHDGIFTYLVGRQHAELNPDDPRGRLFLQHLGTVILFHGHCLCPEA